MFEIMAFMVFLFLILGLWLVCGAITSNIASKKGRSSVGWFFIGLLLGLLGILIAALASPNQEALNKKGVEEGAMKKCPHCAEIIKAEAKICRYCHREVSQPSDEEHLASTPPSEEEVPGELWQGLFPAAAGSPSKSKEVPAQVAEQGDPLATNTSFDTSTEQPTANRVAEINLPVTDSSFDKQNVVHAAPVSNEVSVFPTGVEPRATEIPLPSSSEKKKSKVLPIAIISIVLLLGIGAFFVVGTMKPHEAPIVSETAQVVTENHSPPATQEKLSAAEKTEPSFDCTKAKSVSEKLICGDKELSRLDVAHFNAYKKAKETTIHQEEFIKEATGAWRWREQNCTDKPCLEQWFNERISRYQNILKINEWYTLSPVVEFDDSTSKCKQSEHMPINFWGNREQPVVTETIDPENTHLTISGKYENGSVSEFHFYKNMKDCERNIKTIAPAPESKYKDVAKFLGIPVLENESAFLSTMKAQGEFSAKCQDLDDKRYCSVEPASFCPISHQPCEHITASYKKDGSYTVSIGYPATTINFKQLLKNVADEYGPPGKTKSSQPPSDRIQLYTMQNTWYFEGASLHIDRIYGKNIYGKPFDSVDVHLEATSLSQNNANVKPVVSEGNFKNTDFYWEASSDGFHVQGAVDIKNNLSIKSNFDVEFIFRDADNEIAGTLEKKLTDLSPGDTVHVTVKTTTVGKPYSGWSYVVKVNGVKTASGLIRNLD